MSEKIQESLEASGGVAAPAENLESDKIELPEGYHRMPDGTIMKDSEHESEAALEKESGDPCWEGYVQLGTKMKDGREVPNCVPIDTSNDNRWAQYLLREELEDLVSYFNSEVGPSRATEMSVVEEVANRAVDKYKYLEAVEIDNAIRWDVYGFLEYSALGFTSSAEFSTDYADLLPSGHPYNSEAAIEDYASWVSGASGLDESSRDAVYASIVPSEDHVTSLHASTRVKSLVASGKLPEQTVLQIQEAVLWGVSE
jgi:hypothetical protein